MSIQLTQHAGETNYSTGALQSQLQWPTENGLNDSIIGGPTSQSVRSGLFLLYLFILSGCFLFLFYIFFFYFYPKSPCYIFYHFQFGDFNGIPECANDWVSLGRHQMTSCGSQWELGLHPHQHQMSVSSNFHIPAHVWTKCREWKALKLSVLSGMFPSNLFPQGSGIYVGRGGTTIVRGREAGRHRGERPSNHSRTEAHVNSQSLAECTQPVTGSSQAGSGIEGGHADTISTPNQEAICNGQPLAKGKLVFSRVSSDHHTSGQAHTRE